MGEFFTSWTHTRLNAALEKCLIRDDGVVNFKPFANTEGPPKVLGKLSHRKVGSRSHFRVGIDIDAEAGDSSQKSGASMRQNHGSFPLKKVFRFFVFFFKKLLQFGTQYAIVKML